MDMERVEYLAKMEKVLDIPDGQRLTSWYGDYNIYEPKLDVTQKAIDNRIAELEKRIEHSKPVTVEIRETLTKKVTVENAQNIREAVDTIIERYYNQDIVLDAEDFQGVEFIPEEEMDLEMEI